MSISFGAAAAAAAAGAGAVPDVLDALPADAVPLLSPLPGLPAAATDLTAAAAAAPTAATAAGASTFGGCWAAAALPLLLLLVPGSAAAASSACCFWMCCFRRSACLNTRSQCGHGISCSRREGRQGGAQWGRQHARAGRWPAAVPRVVLKVPQLHISPVICLLAWPRLSTTAGPLEPPPPPDLQCTRSKQISGWCQQAKAGRPTAAVWPAEAGRRSRMVHIDRGPLT